jgi:hypothetical protein
LSMLVGTTDPDCEEDGDDTVFPSPNRHPLPTRVYRQPRPGSQLQMLGKPALHSDQMASSSCSFSSTFGAWVWSSQPFPSVPPLLIPGMLAWSALQGHGH